jgi:hypothetical protein
MVTANVSQGQPYTLPFTSGPFVFSKEEFRELFPDYVVDYMIAISEAYPPLDVVREPIRIKVVPGQDRPVAVSDAAPGKTHTLYFLPRGHDLPVVVATRMSLSFPVLIGAVPLWTLSEACLHKQASGQKVTLEPGDLQRNWFSDGGTCSNFPIHFYDRWFPRKPTFGINLETLPDWLFEKGANGQPSSIRPEVQHYRSLLRPERQDGPHDAPHQWQVFEHMPKARSPEQDTLVQLPTPFPEDRPLPRWEPLCGSLSGFVGSIINTGVFYRDIVQARLPSYYDRIVTVYHSENEGGLNVEMEQPVIDSIVARGAEAGEALRDTFRFERHRWVRLRLLLAEMEEQLIKLRGSVVPPQQRYATAHELCPNRPTSQVRLDWNDPQVAEGMRLLLGAVEAAGLNENVVRHLIDCEIQSLPPQSGAPVDETPAFPYPRDMSWAQQATERFLLLQLLMELWAQKDAAGEDVTFFRDPAAPRRDGMSMRVAPEL